MGSKLSKWLFALGAVLAIVTVVLLYYYIEQIKSNQTSQAFLRLRPDIMLSKGEELKKTMLRSVQVPERFKPLNRTWIADSGENRAWIEGRRVTTDISRGSFLLHEHFLDTSAERLVARIPPDKRALTIPVSRTSAVGYFVEPGSRVDILGTFTEPGARVATRTVQQNVRILAVDRVTTRSGYLDKGRSYGTVTVEVTPLEAEKLVFAMEHVKGDLTLVLRNPEAGDNQEIPSVSWDGLSKLPETPKPLDGANPSPIPSRNSNAAGNQQAGQ